MSANTYTEEAGKRIGDGVRDGLALIARNMPCKCEWGAIEKLLIPNASPVGVIFVQTCKHCNKKRRI